MAAAYPGLPQPARLRAVIAISFGTALLVLDNTIATVALPTIAQALGVERSSAVMIVTLYQLVLLMALLPFSALGDRIGHKRLYQLGQSVFVAATLLCFFVNSLPWLLAVRAVQALGVAAALSVSSALLRRIYPSNRLGRGLGLNSIIIASAAALAPTIGGLILSFGSWRLVFVAAAPLALASLVMGRYLPAPAASRASYDLPGAALCVLMFATLIGGLESRAHGAPTLASASLIGVGIVITTLFVRRERRRPNPILPVDLLARPTFALSTLAALAAFVASMSFTLSLPFTFQSRYGMSPAEIGAMMAFWPMAMLVAAPLAGALSDRAPKGLLGGIGMLMAAASLTLMAFAPLDAALPRLALPLMLGGAGFGFFLAPNSHLIIGTAPPGRVASAGAMVSTTRLIGSTLGGTLLATLLSANAGASATPALAAAACAFVAAVCSLSNLFFHQPRSIPSAEQEPDHAPL